MKIYTKAGDDGKTSLLGSGGAARVGKHDARVDCYGTVDELNASIGWAAVAAGEVVAVPSPGAGPATFADLLCEIQNDLFLVGSHLALADGAPAPALLPPLDEAAVSRLEMQIDAAEAELPPLRNFILPGGSELAARLHVTRTVCRRAERRVVQFAQDRPVPRTILTFLNRLSDWLFVHARLANRRAGIEDVPWHAQRGQA
jgi:cob(I)alamin adenosyltransferase